MVEFTTKSSISTSVSCRRSQRIRSSLPSLNVEAAAHILMKMSRDSWTRPAPLVHAEKEQTEDGSTTTKSEREMPTMQRKRYQCRTCRKIFGSCQALGGHCASHKRAAVNSSATTEEPPIPSSTLSSEALRKNEKKMTI